MCEEEEGVERDGGHDVDEEPALEIVDGDASRVRDDLVVLVHVGCPAFSAPFIHSQLLFASTLKVDSYFSANVAGIFAFPTKLNEKL